MSSSGQPDPPNNVTTTCVKPLQASISWTSQFNGLGNTGHQVFNVMYRQLGETQYTKDKINVSDAGLQKTHTHDLSLATGCWEFKVLAINIIGSELSMSSSSCFVRSKFFFLEELQWLKREESNRVHLFETGVLS